MFQPFPSVTAAADNDNQGEDEKNNQSCQDYDDYVG